MSLAYDDIHFDKAWRSGLEGYGGWSQADVASCFMESKVTPDTYSLIAGKTGIGGTGREGSWAHEELDLLLLNWLTHDVHHESVVGGYGNACESIVGL